MVQSPSAPLVRAPGPFPPQVTWEVLPSDYPLPDDPVENEQQPLLAAALTDALAAAQRLTPDQLCASNIALVATLNGKVVVKAPDWFYVPRLYARTQLREAPRRSYTPHQEGDPVGVVMEFLSDEDNGELSVRSVPPYGKLYFYEQILQVPTYVIYDPYSRSLDVRQLTEGHYVLQSPNDQGRFWIPALSLWLGIWEGERLHHRIHWLRRWDEAGNLLLWSAEQAALAQQQAAAERQRAEEALAQLAAQQQRVEELMARLRAEGIEP